MKVSVNTCFLSLRPTLFLIQVRHYSQPGVLFLRQIHGFTCSVEPCVEESAKF